MEISASANAALVEDTVASRLALVTRNTIRRVLRLKKFSSQPTTTRRTKISRQANIATTYKPPPTAMPILATDSGCLHCPKDHKRSGTTHLYVITANICGKDVLPPSSFKDAFGNSSIKSSGRSAENIVCLEPIESALRTLNWFDSAIGKTVFQLGFESLIYLRDTRFVF